MTHFYPITVAEIHKETKDTVVITFSIPELLREVFKFTQGQHLTLRKTLQDEDVRRTYSLCSSPLEGQWKVAVKEIPNGVFSFFANRQLQVNDTLDIMPPSGQFFVDIDPQTPKNYIAFAAGSGITPIISIIKTHLKAEPQSTFKLFYLNKTVKSIIFKEELEQLKNEFIERFEVYHFLTQEQRDIPLLNGRFDEDKLKRLCHSFIDIEDTAHCFICGPQDMIFLIRDYLEKEGLDKKKIHYELFFSGNTAEKALKHAEIVDEKVDGSQITIIDGGKEFHFTMTSQHDTILDSALEAGADLPFACKGGVCSTCKCQLIEGEVKMKLNYALEEAELNNNYVLSCQAVPVTEKVVVNFDV